MLVVGPGRAALARAGAPAFAVPDHMRSQGEPIKSWSVLQLQPAAL